MNVHALQSKRKVRLRLWLPGYGAGIFQKINEGISQGYVADNYCRWVAAHGCRTPNIRAKISLMTWHRIEPDHTTQLNCVTAVNNMSRCC
jgi:hypothetical protein